MTAQEITTQNQTTAKSKSRQKKSATPAIPNGTRGRVRRKANSASNSQNSATQQEIESHESALSNAETVCINCGGDLLFLEEARLCPKCNSEATVTMLSEYAPVIMESAEMDRGFIECPGATIFDSETGEPLEGAVFGDNTNEGYKVKHMKWPVFPPGHKKRRMIPTEAFGKIRRCRTCQDYTVRMRRKEGADFCAPSSKFPRRKRLKSVDLVSHRQPL